MCRNRPLPLLIALAVWLFASAANAEGSTYCMLESPNGCIGRRRDGSDDLVLKPCDPNDPYVLWRQDGDQYHSYTDDSLCMQAGQAPEILGGLRGLKTGNLLYAKACVAGNNKKRAFQVFNDTDFQPQGLLTLMNRTDLCVVYFGAKPSVKETRIMMIDCNNLVGERAMGWMWMLAIINNTVTPTTQIPTPLPSPTVSPTTARPTGTRPTTAMPTTTRPTTVRPSTVRPSTVRPSTVRPSTVRPSTVRPSTVRPSTVRPSTVRPTTARPTTASPTATSPTTTSPTTARPTTARPTTVRPTTASPTATKPTTAKPTIAPTKAPTPPPTKAPTLAPTKAPTPPPTQTPTPPPTPPPTLAPTPPPTLAPTPPPTAPPTPAPVVPPTAPPVVPPTAPPVVPPTAPPTLAPVTVSPTAGASIIRKRTEHNYVVLDSIPGSAYGGCIGRNADGSFELLYKPCKSNDDNIQWRLDSQGRMRSKVDDNQCLQASPNPDALDGPEDLKNGTRIFVKACAEPNSAKDHFQVVNDAWKGAGQLTLESRPDLCIVYWGTTPVLYETRIILLECAGLRGARAKGWQATDPCAYPPTCAMGTIPVQGGGG